MSRKIACFASVCAVAMAIAGAAKAAPYEVVPSFTSHIRAPEYWIYAATIFDNATGKMYSCAVIAYPADKPLESTCADLKPFATSTLTPSPD